MLFCKKVVFVAVYFPGVGEYLLACKCVAL